MACAPETRRGRAAAETRARIVTAAAELFREHGYEATTVRAIVRAADTTTGNLFSHWPGKAELFHEVCGRWPITDGVAGILARELSLATGRTLDCVVSDAMRKYAWGIRA